MTRRAFFLALVNAGLFYNPIYNQASADDRGARALARHNRQCHAWARTRLRRGLTDRERAFLEGRGCREDSELGWVSGLVFPAGD